MFWGVRARRSMFLVGCETDSSTRVYSGCGAVAAAAVPRYLVLVVRPGPRRSQAEGRCIDVLDSRLRAVGALRRRGGG